MRTPDLDALVLDALRAAGLGATVLVNVPAQPANSLPLIVAHQVPGGTSNRLGVVSGIVDLQAFAATRKAASELARDAYSALMDACKNRFGNSEAHLSWFHMTSGAPVEIRTGDPAPNPALFRFHTTCRITARLTL